MKKLRDSIWRVTDGVEAAVAESLIWAHRLSLAALSVIKDVASGVADSVAEYVVYLDRLSHACEQLGEMGYWKASSGCTSPSLVDQNATHNLRILQSILRNYYFIVNK